MDGYTNAFKDGVYTLLNNTRWITRFIKKDPYRQGVNKPLQFYKNLGQIGQELNWLEETMWSRVYGPAGFLFWILHTSFL